MSFLHRLLGSEDGGFSNRGPLDNYWYEGRGAATRSGVTVSPETAIAVATVFRCVQVLAEAVAQLPLNITRAGEIQEDDEVAILLDRWPNETQTGFEFREELTAAALLRGRGYARIHSGPRGPIGSLEPLHPAYVSEERLSNRKLLFKYRPPDGGGVQTITQAEMFVLRGPACAPRGIIAAARESLGLTIAGDRFGAAQFGRKPQMTGVINVPGTLNDEKASKRMAQSFVDATSGEGNWFLPGVLEAGATWTTVGMSMADAQWLDGRKFQVEETCRWFGVPPYKVGHFAGGMPGKTTEQLSIEFVRDAAVPWLRRWEQAIDRDLVLDERDRVRLDADELLRGDLVARHTAHRIALGGNAFKSADEVRAEEGLRPRGGKWNEIPVQLNTQIGSDPNDQPNKDPGAPNA